MLVLELQPRGKKQNYGLPSWDFLLFKYKQRDIQFYSNNKPIMPKPISELYESKLNFHCKMSTVGWIRAEIVILFPIVRRQIGRIRYRNNF